MKHYTPGATEVVQRAMDAAEAALAPPAEILAQTFGLIRIERTVVVADSIAYVYKRIKTPFGERCLAWRITDHPKPAGPERYDPNRPYFPEGSPNLKPLVEKDAEVSCNDHRMQAVTPGTITTPVPRHP